jgi:hypothetical protein
MLASSVVDRGFELWSGQTKEYEIGMCCFCAKHAALRRKSKDWLARNQNQANHYVTDAVGFDRKLIKTKNKV